jgi:hypothetical protein
MIISLCQRQLGSDRVKQHDSNEFSGLSGDRWTFLSHEISIVFKMIFE